MAEPTMADLRKRLNTPKPSSIMRPLKYAMWWRVKQRPRHGGMLPTYQSPIPYKGYHSDFDQISLKCFDGIDARVVLAIPGIGRASVYKMQEALEWFGYSMDMSGFKTREERIQSLYDRLQRCVTQIEKQGGSVSYALQQLGSGWLCRNNIRLTTDAGSAGCVVPNRDSKQVTGCTNTEDAASRL